MNNRWAVCTTAYKEWQGDWALKICVFGGANIKIDPLSASSDNSIVFKLKTTQNN